MQAVVGIVVRDREKLKELMAFIPDYMLTL
jgi:hypothetical protein